MSADPKDQPDQRHIYDPQAIDWDEIEEWRRIPGPEKVLMGLRLQEMARRVNLAGIRHQHPDADEEEVQRIFAERMAVNI